MHGLPYKATFRDRIIVRMANFLLRFASPTYRNLVEGSITYGLASVRRDNAEGRSAPTEWIL